MTATEDFTVVYPMTDAQVDEELRKLTAQHPGLAARLAPVLSGAGASAVPVAKAGARRAGRSLARGWARVRGCVGSLAACGTATAAVYVGWGLVPGMIATAVSLLVGEKLLETPAGDS